VIKLEPLTKYHDRNGFDCGSAPLNRFLRQTARQHAERGISRTFVLVEDAAPAPKPILGFFSLNICEESTSVLPESIAKMLPDHGVGGVRVRRLAVAKSHQRQGLGKTLLAEALKKFDAISHAAGGIGLFVDAKDRAAKRFYERFGFVVLPPDEPQLFMPLNAIQKALK